MHCVHPVAEQVFPFASLDDTHTPLIGIFPAAHLEQYLRLFMVIEHELLPPPQSLSDVHPAATDASMVATAKAKVRVVYIEATILNLQIFTRYKMK